MPSVRTEMFLHFGKLLESKFSLPEIVRIAGNSKSRPIAKGFRQAVAAFAKGATTRQALEQTGLFAPWEIELLAMGESSGRLSLFFYWLGNFQEKKEKYAHALTFCIIYALLLFHLTLLLPVLSFWGKPEFDLWLQYCATILLVGDGLLVVLWMLAWLGNHGIGRGFPVFTNKLLAAVPLLGQFFFKYELSLAIQIFQGLFGSGILTTKAWGYIATAVTHPKLANSLQIVYQRLLMKESLTTATSYEKRLPRHLKTFLATGEHSAHLDRILLKAKDILEREADMGMRLFLILYTVMFLFVMVLFAAYRLIFGSPLW